MKLIKSGVDARSNWCGCLVLCSLYLCFLFEAETCNDWN